MTCPRLFQLEMQTLQCLLIVIFNKMLYCCDFVLSYFSLLVVKCSSLTNLCCNDCFGNLSDLSPEILPLYLSYLYLKLLGMQIQMAQREYSSVWCYVNAHIEHKETSQTCGDTRVFMVWYNLNTISTRCFKCGVDK